MKIFYAIKQPEIYQQSKMQLYPYLKKNTVP
jgi:hypothetical protein